MRNEWPVNKQTTSDQISFRDRPPVSAVRTVVAVVAHRKIGVLRNLKRFRGIGHDQMSRTISAISILRGHHSLETKTVRDFSIHEQLRWLNSQRVPGQTSQTLDVELALISDVGNIFRAKHKHVTAMRFDEIITELVHKYLIAGVDRAARNDFAAPITHSGRDPKVSS